MPSQSILTELEAPARGKEEVTNHVIITQFNLIEEMKSLRESLIAQLE
jgi:hypothetical protein